MDGKRVDDVQSESQGFCRHAMIVNMVFDQLPSQESCRYTLITLLHTSTYNVRAIFSTQSIALFSFSFTNVVGFTLKDRGVDLFPRQLRAMLFNKCSGRDEAWVSVFFGSIGIAGVHRQDLTLSSFLMFHCYFWKEFSGLMSIFVSTRLPQYDSTAPVESKQKTNGAAKGDSRERNSLLTGLELLFFLGGRPHAYHLA